MLSYNTTNTFFGQQHKIVKGKHIENIVPKFPLVTLAPIERTKQVSWTTERMIKPLWNKDLDEISTMKPSSFFENTRTVLTHSIPSGTIVIIAVIIIVIIWVWKKRTTNRNEPVASQSIEMARMPGERLWQSAHMPPRSQWAMSAPVLNTNNHLLSNSERYLSKQSRNSRRQRDDSISELSVYETLNRVYNRPPDRMRSRISLTPSNNEIYGNHGSKSLASSGFKRDGKGTLNKGYISN